MRIEVRHGAERRGQYHVCAVLVYLRCRCPAVLDMTLPGGGGTRHAALVWNVEEDNAAEALDAVAANQATWSLLVWIPLMQGGGDAGTIERWKELATALLDLRARGDLGQFGLTFAELAGYYAAWEKGLEGWDMTESKVVNRWMEEADHKASLRTRREDILQTVQARFPRAIAVEILDLIRGQDSLELLKEWFNAAIYAATAEEFLAVIRR